MSELVRSRPESWGAGPGGLDDPFLGAQDDTAGMVTVSHGLVIEQFPLGNMTVGEIRRRLADRLNLDPRSQAQIDGQGVGDDVVVRTGQQLLFVRNAGEKGAGSSPGVRS